MVFPDFHEVACFTLNMTLKELVDYYDSHPEDQEEILSNNWKYWNMELDELIEELGE